MKAEEMDSIKRLLGVANAVAEALIGVSDHLEQYLEGRELETELAQQGDRIRALEDLLRRARPTLVSAGMHVLAREVLEILPQHVPDDPGRTPAAPSGERTGWDAPPPDVVARFGNPGRAYEPSPWVLAAWHACFCIECPIGQAETLGADGKTVTLKYALPCPNETERVIPFVFYRGSSEGADAQRMLIGERKYRRKYGMA